MTYSPYMIDRIIAMILSNADEPNTAPKYDDVELLQRLETATRDVVAEINSAADNPFGVRLNLSLTQYCTTFLLPPNVEQALLLVCRDTTTGLVKWFLEPSSDNQPYGPRLRLEGRVLRFDPPWQGSSETVELLYVPNGDFLLHYGNPAAATTTTLTFDSTPTKGRLDARENAYLGAMLRVIPTSGVIQERPITAYDASTKVATVDPAFTLAPQIADVYEVIPSYLRQLEPVLAWSVALQLKAISKDTKGYVLAEKEYRKALRTLKTSLKRVQSITTTTFDRPR